MILGIIIGSVIGFVAGVLVGRKNRKGVEKIIDKTKEITNKTNA